jgi:hypothetical protein
MELSEPLFLKEALTINRSLRKKKPGSLMKLQGISQNLAELNWERNQAFGERSGSAGSRPAVYAFDGDVYQGLDIETFPSEFLPRMQEELRILSGLYGWLRPLDAMQPYRLEMGTSLRIGTRRDLYEYWKKRLTRQMNAEEKDLIVNLASQEYFKALDKKQLKARVITPQFKDMNKGQYRVISFHAKKARGAMARYLLTQTDRTEDVVKGFTGLGYSYSEELTLKPNDPVFVR